MLILPNQLSSDTLSGLVSEMPGLYDVTEIRNVAGRIVPTETVSKFGQAFLNLISDCLPDVKSNFNDYTQGGMYYRVIDLSKIDPSTDKGGEFHYDTRRPGDDLRTDEGPLRVVATLTSDGTDISNIFTANSSYHGSLPGSVIEQYGADELIWAGNGSAVLFDEELDLHARPPALPHPEGTIAVFASAILRMPEHEVIKCEAL